MHSASTCVAPSLIAALKGTGSKTAASTSLRPRWTTGSPATSGTLADARRQPAKSCASAKSSRTTGASESTHEAMTLSGTSDETTLSQRSGAAPEGDMISSRRKPRSRAGGASSSSSPPFSAAAAAAAAASPEEMEAAAAAAAVAEAAASA